MASASGVTIAFKDEDSPSPRSMEVSAPLAHAIASAAAVNIGKESFAISFNSLFIGLLAAPDATGSWLREQFERSNANLDGLLRRRGLTRSDLDRLVRQGLTDTGLPSQGGQPYTRTRSARQALDDAEQRAGRASQRTDTTHVLSAVVTLPGFHDSDFKELGIDREAWAAALNQWLTPTVAPTGHTAPKIDFEAPHTDPHVKSALQVANALAGSSLIEPSHVITAIVGQGQASSSSSKAFKRFAQLVPLSVGTTTPGAVPDAARFNEGLRRQLAIGQRPIAGSTQLTSLWGRDLVTAALLSPGENVGPAVAAGGRSLDAVRDLWYEFVTADSQHRSSSEWTAWWREAGVALPGPRRSGYATETDQGDDKLGVDAEARAFARLILDRDVQAPLSIGLLGDWGSGKSFFIEQIKKEIAELKKEERPELYARVVEIEFNAWHASDSNLWASLVTNIFDEIWENVAPADDTRDPRAARERLQKQIEQARGAVHEAETQVQLGQHALEMAEHDLEEKRKILAWNKYVTSISVEKLKALAKAAGWHESIDTINDVERAVRSLSVSGDRLRAMASALLEKPFRRIALPTALLLLATIAAWLLVDVSSLQAWSANLTKVLATVAGIAGTVIAPLRLAKRKVDGLASELEGINKEYDAKLADVKKKDAAGAEVVARARRELESTEASVNVARARLGELLSQQASLDPRRRLGAFLQERVQTTQYRSQQGIISLVHKDFSELSKYMKDLRESPAKADGSKADADAITPFDRIVLYVDDLDRCRPAHVVNMLEAVHLLLALDLFVVVVAVDSRWLTRALEVYYHDLLASTDGNESDGLRASTPQSYLEKIFQITYALGPMNPERFGNYVSFLTGEEADKKAQAKAAEDAKSVAAQATKSVSSAQTDAIGTTAATEIAHTQEGSQAAQQPAATTTTTRPPTLPVHIEKAEREFIAQLVPLLPTPRIAKRLVNVYRVIKSSKSAEELDAFEHEGRARACLLLLAILFGRPGIAAELLRGLHERRAPFENLDDTLVAALRKRRPPSGEPVNVSDSWAKLITTLETIGITENVRAFTREPKEVARYSLVSGHDWHTWSNPPA